MENPNPRIGSTLDSLLEELGELEEVRILAERKIFLIESLRGNVLVDDDDGEID